MARGRVLVAVDPGPRRFDAHAQPTIAQAEDLAWETDGTLHEVEWSDVASLIDLADEPSAPPITPATVEPPAERTGPTTRFIEDACRAVADEISRPRLRTLTRVDRPNPSIRPKTIAGVPLQLVVGRPVSSVVPRARPSAALLEGLRSPAAARAKPRPDRSIERIQRVHRPSRLGTLCLVAAALLLI